MRTAASSLAKGPCAAPPGPAVLPGSVIVVVTLPIRSVANSVLPGCPGSACRMTNSSTTTGPAEPPTRPIVAARRQPVSPGRRRSTICQSCWKYRPKTSLCEGRNSRLSRPCHRYHPTGSKRASARSDRHKDSTLSTSRRPLSSKTKIPPFPVTQDRTANTDVPCRECTPNSTPQLSTPPWAKRSDSAVNCARISHRTLDS